MIHCYLLPLTFFFLVFGTYPYKNYSSAFGTYACWAFHLSLWAYPQRNECVFWFLHPYQSLDYWIMRGAHSISEILRDLMAECSHMLPQGICKFLKTVSHLSDKRILNWWFSDLTYFQSFTFLIIRTSHDQYLKSQK